MPTVVLLEALECWKPSRPSGRGDTLGALADYIVSEQHTGLTGVEMIVTMSETILKDSIVGILA